MLKYFPASVIALFFLSCNSGAPKEEPVAKVFESCLYHKEVADFIPHATPPEDSLLMAQSYIRNWVTKKLLLHKAIENLSGEEQNIQRQVDDYRTSLLIHRYKQKFINQRLVDEISDSDIESYYQENKENFILATPIIKAVFFIVPKSAPNLNNVRKWYKSDRPEDLESLEEYCITNAKKYDKFNDKWIEAKFILNLVPGDFNTLEREILTQKNIEKEDDENYYFLKIKDLRKDQTTAPVEYVYEEITLILKNKKKLQFESELDKQINEEGIRKNYVKIY